MSYGDSKAVFKRRCEEIGFESDVIEQITNHGLDTMAKFAFACHFSPGSADESPLIQLAKEIMRRAPSTVEMSCVRRLFSESYANVAADIKNSVEATDDMPTPRLAPAERESRTFAFATAAPVRCQHFRTLRTWRCISRPLHSNV